MSSFPGRFSSELGSRDYFECLLPLKVSVYDITISQHLLFVENFLLVSEFILTFRNLVV